MSAPNDPVNMRTITGYISGSRQWLEEVGLVAPTPRPTMTHPPQMVVDWINLAVRLVEAGGIGCPQCRGGTPADAARRGHDRHPKDCKGALERCFGAYNMQTFLTQPAECWASPTRTAEGGE